MGTEIYETPFDFLAPSFSFDATVERGGSHRVTPSSRKIEGLGNISDSAATEASTWFVSGKVSATSLDPLTLQLQTLANAQKKLEELVKKKAIVLVVSGDFLEEFCLITSAEPRQGADDGNSMGASLQFQEMRTTKPQNVQIPASRLRRKVKRKAAAPAKGGATKPTTVTAPDRRGTMLKAGEAAHGRRIG